MATAIAERPAKKKPAKKPKEKEEKEERPRLVCPKAGKVPVHFDGTSGSFYAANHQGEYQRYPDRALNLMLRAAGFSDNERHPNGLTYLEAEYLRITQEHSVHYAGPLGGYPVGIFDVGGSRVLVTRAANYIKPVKGPWPLLTKFFGELFGDDLRYFYAWMKSAIVSLEAGAPWSPGQLLAVAGQPGCGKSFFQSLITPMLGGRVSSPYKYMSGASAFNAEIFGAEHGLIGDQNHRYDKRSRMAFGSAIKELVVNPEQYVRGLYKGAMTLTAFLRLTLTLNDNPHALAVLPEMDSDVADKILLLQAFQVNFPFPSERFPDKNAYSTALRKELPMFLHALRRWNIPQSIRDRRYGVVSYKCPELVKKLDNLATEWKLWHVIEMYLFPIKTDMVWEGTAAELQKILTERARADNIGWMFPHPSSCGTYLAMLEPKLDGAIVKAKGGNNLNGWTIHKRFTPLY